MKKRLFICIMSLYMLLPVCIYAGNGNLKVWVYPNGDRYHKSTCRYAKTGEAVEVTLQEAVEDWNKTPCEICHPPEYEGESTPTVPAMNYKERDDELIELNKHVKEVKNAATNKALESMENGTYRSTPTPVPQIEPDEPTTTNSNNVGTIAIAAAVGSGITVAVNKLMRKKDA